MTKPIRNTGPCFDLSLPRQRGQRDVLSHTEFINVHILYALSLQGHPLRVTRKPPTAEWWVLLLALPEETSITINIVPCVKCALETAARWKGLSRALMKVTLSLSEFTEWKEHRCGHFTASLFHKLSHCTQIVMKIPLQ